MKKELFFLITIFSLAVFLRFYKLSFSPPGLYVDEAAIGYNALSILKTGKDEYGKSFPVYFRSFGDYKMPLYIYLSVLPIKLFGLNIFAVRFISALSGSLTVMVVFFLARIFFPREKKIAVLTSIIFAILPWTVFLSRMGLEMQLGLFFLLSALLFHQKALTSSKLKWWIVTGLFYSLSAYSYHTEKYLALFLFVLWTLIYCFRRTDKSNGQNWKKGFIVAFLIILILNLPQIKLVFSPGASVRIDSLSYFKNNQNVPYRTFPLAILRKWSAMYAAYFSPRNLFFNPDSDPQRLLPDLSVFFSWMVIPFFVGIYEFIKKKTESVGRRFVLFSLLIFPLPASLTGDPFSTFRAFPLVFPITIIISFGILKISAKIGWKPSIPVGIVVLFISLGLLWRSLFILLPKERFLDWKYGYGQLVSEINKRSFNKVMIDDPLGTSYIEVLFFDHFDPHRRQQTRSFDLNSYYRSIIWEKENSFGKYEVRGIYWKKDIYQEQLIVATPIAISDSQAKEHFLTKAFAIIGLDDKVIFNGYITSPKLKIADDLRKTKEK